MDLYTSRCMHDQSCMALVLIVSGGWSGGAMVLGKLPVPGRPAYLD